MLQKIRFFSYYIMNYFYENIRVKVKRSGKLLQYGFNAKRTSVIRIRTQIVQPKEKQNSVNKIR